MDTPCNASERLEGRRGSTLLELLIALAIFSILAVMGTSALQDLLPRWRTRAAALEFRSHIDQCRMLAIRTGRECRIQMVHYDSSLSDLESTPTGKYTIDLGNRNLNSTEWDTLPIDDIDGSGSTVTREYEGTIDIGDRNSSWHKRYVAIDTWGELGGPGSDNNDALVFGPKGWLTNPATDFNNYGYVTITFVNKFARFQGRFEDRQVRIYRTGVAKIENIFTEEVTGK
jgi:prepilin-type N-terminal cleavage/methylation domain-containing protein